MQGPFILVKASPVESKRPIQFVSSTESFFQMDERQPLPRLFHVYMGILVILGAFAMGQSARICSQSYCTYADTHEPHIEGCWCAYYSDILGGAATG